MREAAAGLVRYPLRTILALLGLIMGVSTVVGTFALLDASHRFSMKMLRNYLAPEDIYINSPEWYWEKYQRVSIKAPVRLDRRDAEHLRGSLPDTYRVRISSSWDRTIRRQGISFKVPVRGVETSTQMEIVRGRFFTDAEIASAARTVVLSVALAEDLFGDPARAAGEILLDGQRFEVVGVSTEMRRWDGEEPRLCYIPFRTSVERFGRLGIGAVSLRVTAPSMERVKEALEDVKAVLRFLRPGTGLESYQVETAEEDLQFTRTQDLIQSLTLGAVAGLSMLIAAGGILNTLLVGVKQRTTEIGTRRAIGATRRAIRAQFLQEALLLSLPGALFGLGFGIVLAHQLGKILAAGLLDPAAFSVIVGPREAALACLSAILVSLGAGVWPAIHASRIPPAVALRYE